MSRRGKAGLAAWSQLAQLSGEMMLASASVIQHRAARMAKASYPLSPKDRREFTQMVEEKVEAGSEAAVALVWASFNPLFMTGDAAAARAAKAVIKPFHKRAKANARRLKSK